MSSEALTSLVFIGIRIACLFAALGFIDLSSISFEQSVLYFDRFLRACAVLLFWNLTEGALMLWVREKNRLSNRSRGYGAVTCILGIVVLILLQAFRSQTTQPQFLLMLTALAFRGMSRSCWEQDRPHAATLLAPASHAILALLSFYLILESWTWQSVIVSIAVGTLTGAVEITWHVLRFHQSTPRWLLPLYRLSISIPAVAIGSLSLIRELPSSYTIVLAHLLVTTRFTWNKGKSNTIPEGRFTTLALIYLLFVGLVIIALVYS